MDLRTGLRLLRDRWKSIVAAVVLAAIAGGVTTWRQTPQYAAEVTLFVSAWGNSSDASSAYAGSLASQQRVKSYTELLRSDRVMSRVDERLDLRLPYDRLAAKVTTAVIPETVLLVVTVTDRSPTRARDIANAVADEFVRQVPELENSPDGKQPAVRVTVVNPAALPTRPVSPDPLRNMAIALLLGLLGGAAVAAARHTLDTTVKGVEQLGTLTGVASLGTVTRDAAAVKNPLVINDAPYSPRAEAFRKIRTSMQFVDVDRAHKVVLVTSAVAGEGKTTTACNLAITLAQAGKRVLLIDADLRRPRAARYLGLPGGVGLTSVLVGNVDLDAATQPWGDDLLSVLASGPIPPNPSELLGSQHMRTLLDDLRDRYDLVIIDGPPVLPVADAVATSVACDGVVLVVRHGRTRREQVQGTLDALRTVDAHILGTVLNLVPLRGERSYYQEYGALPSAEPVGVAAGTSRADGDRVRA